MEHGCDHCMNLQGGFECHCPDGYELAENEKSCVDIDECEEYEYEEELEDGKTEIRTAKICSHTCTNSPGSYKCSCPEHYHLRYDQRNCERTVART